ncbi:MAG: hypothetical protein HYV99_06340 [Betaproteobacteria bacterium]|nr:hypothetical protein [Betaproteobacteria bacterium]MBI2509579.1 hypothetical protein [Betaproteobacteria bacterium]
MSASERLIELARRKERLIARAAAQRAAVAATIREWRAPIAVADQAFGIVRFFRSHPVLLAAAVAAIAALRGRTLIGLAGRGYTAWRVWRATSSWLARIFARRGAATGSSPHAAS